MSLETKNERLTARARRVSLNGPNASSTRANNERKNTVRPSATEFSRAAERNCEYVDVGEIRTDHQSRRGESGAALEACLR